MKLIPCKEFSETGKFDKEIYLNPLCIVKCTYLQYQKAYNLYLTDGSDIIIEEKDFKKLGIEVEK